VPAARSAVGRGDDGNVHAIFRRRVHRARIFRRGSFRGDVETRWRLSADAKDAAVASSATGACGRSAA